MKGLTGVLVVLSVLCSSCLGLRRIAGSASWRSDQPEVQELELLAQEGVRSVICLRRPSPNQDWYKNEVAACQKLGMNFRTLSWSATCSDKEQIERLIQAFEELPGPYLIHCKHGVDRAGLGSAVFRVVVLGHTKIQAGSELSILYGHLPIFETRAMDRAWRKFKWRPPVEAKEQDGQVAVKL